MGTAMGGAITGDAAITTVGIAAAATTTAGGITTAAGGDLHVRKKRAASVGGLLLQRRLAVLVGHLKGDFRHLFADLIHHRIDLAPHHQIVRAPRRDAAQVLERPQQCRR